MGQAGALPGGQGANTVGATAAAAVAASTSGQSANTTATQQEPASTAGSLKNGGTLAGRELVNIDTKSIEVLNGRISGGVVNLKAQENIDVVGGTVDARQALSVQAGGDVNVRTTTSTQTGLLSSVTGVDRVAGLYVSNPDGRLSVAAGGDLNVQGARIVNAGDGGTRLSAGGDVNIGTVDVGSNAIALGKNFAARTSSTAEVGSTITSGGGVLSIDAGRDLVARQATVQGADGVVLMQAGRDLVMQAGESTSSLSIVSQNTKKGLITSKSTRQQIDMDSSTSVGSQVQGALVWADAGRDMLLEAAKVDGSQGVGLSAGGNLAIVEGRDSRSVSVDTQSSKTLGGILAPGNASIKKTGTTVEIATDTANASRINSSQGGVTLQAGETAVLQGVQVSAAKDLRIEAADVIVRAAENTTTVTGSHSSKSGLLDLNTHVLTDVGKGLKAKETGQSELTRTDLARSSLSGANVSIEAAGTALISATDVGTPGTLSLKADTVVLGTQASETGSRTTSQGRDIV